ncbi:MAG: hypothetical protein J6J55_00825 [Paludibacteraceae bacterium]|nr:hypothetical protein [Paludibacteraceae bacterium]
MKKIMNLATLLLMVTLMATSCKEPVVVTYPDNLTGYWEAASSEKDKWYGLDIDATNATLITYYTEEDPVEQAMSLTYDATTGKGKLLGEGKSIPVRATSDSTIALTMVEGTVVFYRGVRPKPTINMVGLWKSNRIDDMGIDLLVYPKDSKGTNAVTMITVDEMFNEQMGVMGTLSSFNQEIGSGVVTTEYYTGKCHVIASTNPMTMTLDDIGELYVFTKQPKAQNMPKSLQGEWRWSAVVASINIVVTEENKVEIYYQTIDEEGNKKSGMVKGNIHYCQAAGMGAVVAHNLEEHPELVQYIGMNNCGVFQVISATEVYVTFNGIPFTFIKK